ncbi:MAG: cupin domain-containing protein [Candidatus Thorarchaeota archaeon]|jgi:mannose-6-phosphate isomerase-like protein (cupin superfamily)
MVSFRRAMDSMIVKRFEEQDEIVALDDTRVREFLNPKHDKEGLHLTYSLAHASIAPGKSSLPHRFLEASEVYYILRGKGMMHINDEVAEVGPGDTIYIPPMAVQFIESIGEENLDFLCIVDPAWQPDAEELV